MADLGAVQRPISCLFDVPRTVDEWAPYVLDEAVCLEFAERGFVRGVRLLNDAYVDALQKELLEMKEPECDGKEHFYEYHRNESKDAGSVLFHALGAWRVRPAFHDLLWHPAFQMAAYQLLGTGVRFFHDQVFGKPPRQGGVVAWHQDYSYWTWTQPMNHLSAWIALDDADEENGCLHYVPGSHRWGLLEKTRLAGDMDSVLAQLSPEQARDFERREPAVTARGEASFHHPLMLHGSYGNRSPRPRNAAVINVFADGTRSNMSPDTAPGTERYPHVEKGQPMGGNGYPLLFDPKGDLADWLRDVPTAPRL